MTRPYALNQNGGITSHTPIPGAVSDYVSSKGYSGQAVNIDYPNFWDLQFEINYGDPCLVGFPGYPFSGAHMTTGIGYKIENNIQFVVVNDNHSVYSREIEFSYVDFISGIDIY